MKIKHLTFYVMVILLAAISVFKSINFCVPIISHASSYKKATFPKKMRGQWYQCDPRFGEKIGFRITAHSIGQAGLGFGDTKYNYQTAYKISYNKKNGKYWYFKRKPQSKSEFYSSRTFFQAVQRNQHGKKVTMLRYPVSDSRESDGYILIQRDDNQKFQRENAKLPKLRASKWTNNIPQWLIGTWKEDYVRYIHNEIKFLKPNKISCYSIITSTGQISSLYSQNINMSKPLTTLPNNAYEKVKMRIIDKNVYQFKNNNNNLADIYLIRLNKNEFGTIEDFLSPREVMIDKYSIDNVFHRTK